MSFLGEGMAHGSIDFKRYCERIVPIIDGYLRLIRQEVEGSYLQMMQDGAASCTGYLFNLLASIFAN